MIMFKNLGSIFRRMGIVVLLMSYTIPQEMPTIVFSGLSLLLSSYLADKAFKEKERPGSTKTESVQKQKYINTTKVYRQNEKLSRGGRDG